MNYLTRSVYLLILLLCFSFQQNSWAFVTLVHLKKDHHQVLLLGDLHNSSYDKMNKEDASLLARLGFTLSGLAKLKPTAHSESNCYYEMSPEEALALAKGTKESGKVATTFEVLARSPLAGTGVSICRLIPLEPRTTISDHSNSHFNEIRSIVYRAVQENSKEFTSADSYIEFATDLAQAKIEKSRIRLLFKERGAPSLGAYLSYLGNLVGGVKTARNRFDSESAAYDLIDGIYNQLVLRHSEILERTSAYREDDFLMNVLFDHFDMASRTEGPFVTLKKMQNFLFDQFEYRFVDVAYLAKILEEANAGKRVTIAITGNGHTQEIKSSLVELGYSVEDEVRSFAQDVITEGGMPAVQYILEEGLPEKLNSLMRTLHGFAPPPPPKTPTVVPVVKDKEESKNPLIGEGD